MGQSDGPDLTGHARRRRHPRGTVDRAWARVLLALRTAARRPTRVVVAFGLLGLIGSAAIDLVRGVPAPALHDEFSYLLAADTFCDGRLTNPTHPFWHHFETFHVIHQPTYMSKYPPGQGLVLAVGQCLVGDPILGVWLSAGLLAAATAWMLLAWLPPVWAILAASFCLTHLCWASYWAHSYWGGSVAAVGGALAFGGLRRMWDRPRAVHGMALGAGLGIMAASRPFEGAIAGMCIAVGLAVRLRRSGVRVLMPALLTTGACLALCLGWLGYYQQAVTGSPLTMPYQVHESQYSPAPPLLLYGVSSKPQYRHRELERYWMDYAAGLHDQQRQFRTFVATLPYKLVMLAVTLVGPGALSLLGLRGLFRRGRWYGFVAVSATIAVSASLLTTAALPHYLAPITCLLFVLVGGGLWSLHRHAVAKRTANIAIISVMFLIAVTPLTLSNSLHPPPLAEFARQRVALTERLTSEHKKALVIVVYGPQHNFHHEWVYNRADIDGSPIVWARSMGEVEDRELIRYFADRQVWLLTVDDQPILEPYPHREHLQ